METSLYKIAHALYVISDKIKDLRKKKIMRDEVASYSHTILNSIDHKKIIRQLQDEINKLYDLKDSCISTLRRKYGTRPIGYHVDIDGKKRDMYKIQHYKFHSNSCTSNNYLGEIDTTTINDDRKLRLDKIYDEAGTTDYVHLTKEQLVKIRKMSFSEAFKILRLFCNRKDLKFK